ncbi:MAG: hypothetical protein ACI83B_000785 [Sediminicola sp.]|jgi:hypothetical protein
MKKLLEEALVFFGILNLLYPLLGQAEALKAYNIPTTSSEPNIKVNYTILASGLVDYENDDFVSYKFNKVTDGEHIRVHRLLAMSGYKRWSSI